jgi:hypothetical protein
MTSVGIVKSRSAVAWLVRLGCLLCEVGGLLLKGHKLVAPERGLDVPETL